MSHFWIFFLPLSLLFLLCSAQPSCCVRLNGRLSTPPNYPVGHRSSKPRPHPSPSPSRLTTADYEHTNALTRRSRRHLLLNAGERAAHAPDPERWGVLQPKSAQSHWPKKERTVSMGRDNLCIFSSCNMLSCQRPNRPGAAAQICA